jgi:hypothetical protein
VKRVGQVGLAHAPCPTGKAFQRCVRALEGALRAIPTPPNERNFLGWERIIHREADRSPVGRRFLRLTPVPPPACGARRRVCRISTLASSSPPMEIGSKVTPAALLATAGPSTPAPPDFHGRPTQKPSGRDSPRVADSGDPPIPMAVTRGGQSDESA